MDIVSNFFKKFRSTIVLLSKAGEKPAFSVSIPD
ncbi:hypothetical protein BACFRA24663_17360 [Bacteroides fragilis]